MNDLNKRVGFIGAGNMATALISGLINSKYEPLKIIASSPEAQHLQKLEKDFGIQVTENNIEVIKNTDIIILAVKPNIIEDVVNEISDSINHENHLVISIAAGIKIEKIAALMGSKQKIIRAMPNTPASIMEGVTALCSNKFIKSEDITDARILFECVGKVSEIKENNIKKFRFFI